MGNILIPQLRRLLAASFFCTVLSVGSWSDANAAPDWSPLQIRNYNPFALPFAAPQLSRPGVLAHGENAFGVTTQISNTFSSDESNDERIRIDGEVTAFNFRFRRGFRDRWEVGLDVPVLHHSGGFLDSTIDRFHSAFNLSNVRDDEDNRSELLYSYSANGVEQLHMDSENTGIGDITLSVARAIGASDERTRTRLQAQIKLPTGDSDRFRGSDAMDLSLIAQHGRALTATTHLGMYAGASYLGKGDILSDKQRRWAGYGGINFGWHVASALTLKIQLDANTAFFENTDLREIGNASYIVGIGGSLRTARYGTLDIGVVENVFVHETGVDFGLLLTWRTSQ